VKHCPRQASQLKLSGKYVLLSCNAWRGQCLTGRRDNTLSQGKQTLAAPKTGVWQGGGKGGDKGILSFQLVKNLCAFLTFWSED